MSTTTGIEWTDTTWNPQVTLHPDRLDAPLRWRKPRRVFVNSMADLFHDQVPDEFITEVFARMWWAPQHTFQVLTKRHARMRSLLPRIETALRQREHDLALVDCPTPLTWPLPHVWLGVSVEDHQRADLRIPTLLDTPAAVRFLSCEPLLGPVDLGAWLGTAHRCPGELMPPGSAPARGHTVDCCTSPALDWVIIGGESGPGARAMHPDWARALLAQCTTAGVAVFVKQLGTTWARHHHTDPKAADWSHWPPALRVRDYPRTGDR